MSVSNNKDFLDKFKIKGPTKKQCPICKTETVLSARCAECNVKICKNCRHLCNLIPPVSNNHKYIIYEGPTRPLSICITCYKRYLLY